MKTIGIRNDLHKENKNTIHITFKNIYSKSKIKKDLKKALLYFLDKEQLPKKVHFFVVGLGNDNFTSDSIGPKVLKELQVNSYANKLGIELNKNKISALEPGALIETGIDTADTIKSVLNTIRPHLLLCIDSFVCENEEDLNHTIEITNQGIIPGSGLKGFNQEINKRNMKISVLTIGVPTAIELQLAKKTYLLSSKDVDEYVLDIAKIIGETLNEVLPNYGLK